MGSFASELGVQFEACMEAPHVIDVESQLWASVITSGPGNCQLNASYKTADGYAFQDSLGASLEEICKIVPGGALVFFPSYKLLEKLRLRWCQTGQWSRLNAQKTVFIEPRRTDEFESVLGEYYDSIRGKSKTSRRKAKASQKRLSKKFSPKGSPESSLEGGAALLAVCRGKVSEGIDFADENARVVVIVGIPFPNTNDTQVVLKKRYNDIYKSSKSLLSGSDWYCHQAFRALNQAAGRCIRHRFDYGAIIFLDERLKEQRNLNYISKWLRNSIKQYGSFDESMEGLRSFFEQKRSSQEGRENEFVTSDSENDNLNTSEENLIKMNTQKKNQKQKKLNPRGRRKIIPDNTVTVLKNLSNDDSLLEAKALCLTKSAGETYEELINGHREYVDLESSSLISRCSVLMHTSSSKTTLDKSLISDNTGKEYHISKPDVVSKSGNSFSRTVQTYNQIPDGQSFSCCTTISNGLSSEYPCTTAISPERVYLDISDAEKESSLNKSVNSYNHRKRKLMGAQDKNCARINGFSYSNAESCNQFDCMSTRNLTRHGSQRIGSTLVHSPSEGEPQSHGLLVESTKSVSPILHDVSAEKKLCICCLACKNPLGLLENNFLVACSSTSSSKTYLSYVLNNEPTNYSFSECLSRIPRIDICVIVSDISSVDQRLFERCTREGASQHDIWCEEDGCVFRTVFCPFCSGHSTCLGVQIKAADALNVHFLNKVVFFADHLYINDEQMPIQEPMLLTCADNLRQGPGTNEIEKYAHDCQVNGSALENRIKSKLRLPKPF